MNKKKQTFINNKKQAFLDKTKKQVFIDKLKGPKRVREELLEAREVILIEALCEVKALADDNNGDPMLYQNLINGCISELQSLYKEWDR